MRKLSIPAVQFTAGSPRAVTGQLFKKLIQWASKEKRTDRYGRKVRLAEEMSRVSGGKIVTRQMVSMWLHPKPSQRTQPTFGFGLLLLVVGTGLMRERKPVKISL